MNSNQAKNIQITTYLEACGEKPAYIRGKEHWYHAFYRVDNNPSLKVDVEKNLWYDQGIKEGGDLIKLAQKKVKGNVSKALADIEKRVGKFDYKSSSIVRHLSKSTPAKPTQGNLKLIGVAEIKDKSLHDFLLKRCIIYEYLKPYVKQVSFRIGEEGYKQEAIGLQTKSNGYEIIKDHGFKSSVGGRKSITEINIKAGNKLAIFEGQFDFYSFLTNYRITDLKSSVIILNSTALANQALEVLNSVGFSEIYLFLDNDVAGEKTKQEFICRQSTINKNSSCVFKDKSSIYEGSNDYNEWWVKHCKTREKKGLLWW